MVEKRFTKKTIQKHINNVDFYINVFLNYYDAQSMKEGCYCINEFLGDWFIRKAMWSSTSSIKANSASIKKFYKFMLEKGYIDLYDYKILTSTITRMMPLWLRRMDQYDMETEDILF